MNEKENQKKEEVKDDIVKDFDSVVREGSVLSCVSGIIFGFLLNISINSPPGFTSEDSIILMISLYSITFAVSFFVMPVIYYHIQYPYRGIDKFKIRSHQFIKFGLHTGIGPSYEHFSYILAIVPFVLVFIFFRKRK